MIRMAVLFNGSIYMSVVRTEGRLTELCVCVFGFTVPVGTRSPHKDSKTKKTCTSRAISPVPTRKKAGLVLGVRFRVRS